jgi:hypothetical protein
MSMTQITLCSFEGVNFPLEVVKFFLSRVEEMNTAGAGILDKTVLSVVLARGVTKTFPLTENNKLKLLLACPYWKSILDNHQTEPAFQDAADQTPKPSMS